MKNVACSSSPKYRRQVTTLHQQNTTITPPKNHVYATIFPKTPSKNSLPPAQKKIPQKHPLQPNLGIAAGASLSGSGRSHEAQPLTQLGRGLAVAEQAEGTEVVEVALSATFGYRANVIGVP
jgi:hypothetical protein